MRPVHLALRDLVSEHGERLLEDDRELTSVLAGLQDAGEVTAGQSALLVDTLQRGAFDAMIALLERGDEPVTALRSAAADLAAQRGDHTTSLAQWALATLAGSVELVPEADIPAWPGSVAPATESLPVFEQAAAPVAAGHVDLRDDLHADLHDEDPDDDHHERPRKRRSGCVPILLVAVLFVAILAWFARGAISDVKDMFAGADDFSGPGTGEVMLVVDPGQSVASMGTELEDLGVVASSDAFVDAAASNEKSTGIQAGTYLLRKEMKASDVVDILVNPKNVVQDVVTVNEGMRTSDVLKRLAKETGFQVKDFKAIIDKPTALDLPASAGGNVEGYLFPATYPVTPQDTPESLLKKMVDKWKSVAADLDLDNRAKNVGLTPHEVLTVASILEFEANRTEDYPKVARAIYNRLDIDMRLQSDATVAYANGLSGEVWTTADQRQIDSPYNTYANAGLPPGPIGNPGEETLEAALKPAKGPWLYWVVVNLKTGETVFSTTLAEHNRATERLREYCRTSDAC